MLKTELGHRRFLSTGDGTKIWRVEVHHLCAERCKRDADSCQHPF